MPAWRIGKSWLWRISTKIQDLTYRPWTWNCQCAFRAASATSCDRQTIPEVEKKIFLQKKKQKQNLAARASACSQLWATCKAVESITSSAFRMLAGKNQKNSQPSGYLFLKAYEIWIDTTSPRYERFSEFVKNRTLVTDVCSGTAAAVYQFHPADEWTVSSFKKKNVENKNVSFLRAVRGRWRQHPTWKCETGWSLLTLFLIVLIKHIPLSRVSGARSCTQQFGRWNRAHYHWLLIHHLWYLYLSLSSFYYAHQPSLFFCERWSFKIDLNLNFFFQAPQD